MGALDQSTNIGLLVNTSRRRDPLRSTRGWRKKKGGVSQNPTYKYIAYKDAKEGNLVHALIKKEED